MSKFLLHLLTIWTLTAFIVKGAIEGKSQDSTVTPKNDVETRNGVKNKNNVGNLKIFFLYWMR